jgi:ABC-type antimicrobial peptide transport system permease subunit
MTQMVKVGGDPVSVVPAIRAVLSEIDPELVLFQPQPLSEVIGAGNAQERFAALLLAVFGGLAVLLAGLGLYGVLSHLVGQQHHEIGVRIALGADRAEVLGMIVRRGLRLALVGSAAGLVLAFALSGTLEAFMFEVSARDPLVFSIAPLVLLGIAGLSSYLPASRATNIDPVESFRAD